MQISHCDQSTDNRMGISTSLEIKTDCVGQTYFEFMQTITDHNLTQTKDESSHEQILQGIRS